MDERQDQLELNHRALVEAMAELRAMLERHIDRKERNDRTIADGAEPTPDPPQLHILSTAFGLSRFERSILLLCAAIELDSAFAGLCATAQGNPLRTYPTFSLALAALDEPHWSALSPPAPLRRWRLIEVQTQPGASLVTSPLQIDERILHYLAGVNYLDERLAGLLQLVSPTEELVPSHAALADAVGKIWSRPDTTLPAIQLCRGDQATKRSIAATSANAPDFGFMRWQPTKFRSVSRNSRAFFAVGARIGAQLGGAVDVEADSIEREDSRVTTRDLTPAGAATRSGVSQHA